MLELKGKVVVPDSYVATKAAATERRHRRRAARTRLQHARGSSGAERHDALGRRGRGAAPGAATAEAPVSRHEIDVEQLARNVVAPVADEQDRRAEVSLRPSTLAEFVGQRELVRHLEIVLGFGAGPQPDRRSPLVRGTAGTRQDLARQHRRRRDGRRAAHHLRTGALSTRRPGGAAHGPPGRRRPVRRRDPPTVARRRGDPLSGDGGPTPGRHDRTRSVGARHPTRPAQLHARGRDDAHRPGRGAAARPIRLRRPARPLRPRGPDGDRRVVRPGSWTSS